MKTILGLSLVVALALPAVAGERRRDERGQTTHSPRVVRPDFSRGVIVGGRSVSPKERRGRRYGHEEFHLRHDFRRRYGDRLFLERHGRDERGFDRR